MLKSKTQICNRCELELPLEDFVRNTMYGNGHTHRCKPCAREYEKVKLEWENDPNLTALDYCMEPQAKTGAEFVLRGLGYELYNKHNPVYIQFNRRMLLKYGVTLD